jgi:phospholipase C
MMENRSFDHIFGDMPKVNGLFDPPGQLKPDIYNTMHPESQPDDGVNPRILSRSITPENQGIAHDFNHNFADGMLFDLFGPSCRGIVGAARVEAKTTWPADNAGFVSTKAWNADPSGKTPNGPTSMSYFEWGTLKALHALAAEFVVCDNWHCDVPGQTWVNRVFLHCGQSDGLLEDDGGAPMANLDSIYDLIEQHGRTWKMYARAQHCDTQYLNETVDAQNWSPERPFEPNRTRVRFSQLQDDILSGQLPDFGFIMCWDNPPHDEGDTSMHPPERVEGGENLIASVYNLLRNSPSWESTLLVVTFDENGGMYDHVKPPQAPSPVVPPVVGHFTAHSAPETVMEFDFTLLGPRVPVLLVSPYLARGIDSTQYQNTSVTRFVEEQIETAAGAAPGSVALTQRDRLAASLSSAFAQFGLETPRPDCIGELDYYSGFRGIEWPGDPDAGG